MKFSEEMLTQSERIILGLRQLYSDAGYRPYLMSKFEEYDLYARNKDFLVSDNVITFTDTSGKLMALKPDVTLSIIKNSEDRPEAVEKVFYNENVYRVSERTGAFKEIMQSGVECFGKVEKEEITSTISLACSVMENLSENSVLCISDLEILNSLILPLGLPREKTKLLFTEIGRRNLNAIKELCGDDKVFCAIEKLLLCETGSAAAAETLYSMGLPAADRFADVLSALSCPVLKVDFSVVDDPAYYNSIVFKGFVRGIPEEVLSGGKYDNLMRKMGRKSKAIGFAVYTDTLVGINASENTSEYLNIALPKGRLGEKVYRLFEKAGLPCPELLGESRKLIFENPEKKVRYFWVKPSDVAIYVERGAADIGVAGKDILLEAGSDIYELVDLNTGKCRMTVSAPEGFTDNLERPLRVATKFPEIASSFYRKRGRDIDIIMLNGSIELAPILGLSDVIVDIVETGTTLKENNLEVFETIDYLSARLAVNKVSYSFRRQQIDSLAASLKKASEEKQ